MKEKIRIIHTSLGKLEIEAKGAIRISTNKKIDVTIVGEKDILTKQNLGGYIAIHPNDFKTFLRVLRETKKRSKRNADSTETR